MSSTKKNKDLGVEQIDSSDLSDLVEHLEEFTTAENPTPRSQRSDEEVHGRTAEKGDDLLKKKKKERVSRRRPKKDNTSKRAGSDQHMSHADMADFASHLQESQEAVKDIRPQDKHDHRKEDHKTQKVATYIAKATKKGNRDSKSRQHKADDPSERSAAYMQTLNAKSNLANRRPPSKPLVPPDISSSIAASIDTNDEVSNDDTSILDEKSRVSSRHRPGRQVRPKFKSTGSSEAHADSVSDSESILHEKQRIAGHSRVERAGRARETSVPGLADDSSSANLSILDQANQIFDRSHAGGLTPIVGSGSGSDEEETVLPGAVAVQFYDDMVTETQMERTDNTMIGVVPDVLDEDPTAQDTFPPSTPSLNPGADLSTQDEEIGGGLMLSATAVEDEVIADTAIVVDVEKEDRNRRRRRIYALLGVLAVIAAIATAIGVTTSANARELTVAPSTSPLPSTLPSSSPSFVPTSSPSDVPSFAPSTDLFGQLAALSPDNGTALFLEGSAEQRAFVWIRETLSLADIMPFLPSYYALVTLYYHLFGNQWTQRDGWLELIPNEDETVLLPASFCRWQGVVCRTNNAVTALRLSSNSLFGSIPEVLGVLSRDLKELDLYNNSLAGTLPSGFFGLTNLEILDLSRNAFSELPTEISALSKLAVLDLSDNVVLTGTIPSEIISLTQLTSLDLSGNSLEGELPSFIASLKLLESFSVNSNRFVGSLPIELGNMTALVELDVGHNAFRGDLPAFLGSLSQLELLNVEINSFEGSLPISVMQLTQLIDLNVDGNRLTGTIPAAFGNLSKLQNLNLGFNLFSGALPEEFGYLTAITSLDLFGVFLMEYQLPSVIGLLSQMQSLRVESAFYGGSLPPELLQLTRLTALQLVDTLLVGTFPSEIGRLTNLVNLAISGNSFVSLPSEIGLLTKLTSFKARSTFDGETDLPKEIGLLTDLETLLLNDNMISSLPTQIGTLSKLNEFAFVTKDDYIMSGTLISEIGLLTRLTTLHAPNTFACCFQLPSEVGALTHLSSLDFRNSGVNSTLPSEIGYLTNLRELILSENVLIEVPTQLGELTALTALRLDSNSLVNSLPTELGKLESIEIINFDFNSLSGSIPSEIGDALNLVVFSAVENNIIHMPSQMGALTNLNELTLTNNAIVGTIHSEFGNLLQLSRLSLSSNDISGTLPSELGLIPNIKEVFLDDNQLSGIIPTEFSNWGSIEQLILTNNTLYGNVPQDLCNKVGFSAIIAADCGIVECVCCIDECDGVRSLAKQDVLPFIPVVPYPVKELLPIGEVRRRNLQSATECAGFELSISCSLLQDPTVDCEEAFVASELSLGLPYALVFRYSGAGCDDAFTIQDISECNEYNGGTPKTEGVMSYIEVFDGLKAESIYFSDQVAVGSDFILTNHGFRFASLIVLNVYTEDGPSPENLLQRSQFLVGDNRNTFLFDDYGGIFLAGYVNEIQGYVSALVGVAYSFTVGTDAATTNSTFVLQSLFSVNSDFPIWNLTDQVSGLEVLPGTSYSFNEYVWLDLSTRQTRSSFATISGALTDDIECNFSDFYSSTNGYFPFEWDPEPTPTSSPTITSAPSTMCTTSTDTKLSLEVVTQYYGVEETSWQLDFLGNGTTIEESTLLNIQRSYYDEWCLEDGCYRFTIRSSIGTTPSLGCGSAFHLIWGGDVIRAVPSGQFGSESVTYFGSDQRCASLVPSASPSSSVVPTSIPTQSMAPSISCVSMGGTDLTFNLATDRASTDTSWKLKFANGTIIQESMFSLASFSTYFHKWCLQDGCYRFTVLDSFGNGLFPQDGAGFQLTFGGDIIADDANFSSVSVANFGSNESCFVSPPSASPSLITQNPTTTLPPSTTCVSSGTKLSLELSTDQYFEETSWQLDFANGTNIESSEGLRELWYHYEEWCLEDGCYVFTIRDSYGDGLAVTEGAGFRLIWDGATIKEGTDFEFESITEFGSDEGCVSITS